MSACLRAAAASIGPANGDLFAQLAAASRAIARLMDACSPRLVVLPELFALPYTAGANPADVPVPVETLNGPTARWAQTQAEYYGIDLVFGVALKGTGSKALNAALLARADGTIRQVGSKHNLPPKGPDDLFGEPDHFSPGEREIRCFELDGMRIAVLICYERRIKERWLDAIDAGADLVLVLVAGPAPQDPDGFYLSELSGHAREHCVHVLAAARAGTETVLGHPVNHDGLTVAIDAFGVVCDGGRGGEDDTAMLDLYPVEIEKLRSVRELRASTLIN
jgi:N-carbamoylputrescine amidase